MLSELLQYLKRWYVCTLETKEFDIVADGIEGDFTETYLVGQYISIDGSVLNDGVYKLTEVTASKLTVEETLLPESVNTIYLWALAIPRDIISLSETIKTYVDGSTDGVSSESQGNRSVSYGGTSSWTSVFSSRLSSYRSVVSDKETFGNSYSIDTKRYY